MNRDDKSPPAPDAEPVKRRDRPATGETTWAEFREARVGEAQLFSGPIPFVGRRAEVERMYNTVRDALNSRQVRSVWVFGAPGLGKTRILTELERAVGPAKRKVGWYRIGRGADVAGPPSLAGRLLLELVGGSGVLRSEDAWGTVQRKLAEIVNEQYATDCMAVVAPLLGIRALDTLEDESVRRVEAPLEVSVQFVASLWRHRGKAGPFVLQLDASVAPEQELFALVQALRTALAGTAAAILIAGIDPPPAGMVVEVVGLEPLTTDALRQLGRQLVKRVSNAPVDLVESLVQQAAGVPERLVDVLRGMVAAGEIVQNADGWTFRQRTERGAVWKPQERPGTTSNLPDRIARLPGELREVIDAAAIFGPRLWFGGVLSVIRGGRGDRSESLSERDRVTIKAAMMQLQSLDLVQFVETSSLARELEFSFVYPTDPVAIVTEMHDEKRSLYSRLAAQWLASRPRQDPVSDHARIGELYEHGGRNRLAAQHFLEGGNAARAVGQTERAVALFAAGARNSFADDADLACDLRTAHGGSLLRLSQHQQAEAVLLEALHMARCLDDDLRCGIVQLRIGQVARVSGRYDMALQFLEGALKHLRVIGAHRWIADVSDELGLLCLVQGEQDAYKNALQHFLKALALRRRSEDRRVVARSLCHIARVHMGRGHFADAMEAVGEAVQVCDQIQEKWGAAEARCVQGEVFAASGKMKQALATWNNAHDLAADNGDRARLLEINVLRAEALIGMEDWQQAAALMVDALEIAKDINDPELLSGIYRVQAAISLERVALETADLDSEKAVQVARESGARMQVARALLVRACVLGTRALSEKGARSTVIDRKCTEAFEDALTGFREMGDIVRLAAALRSYVSYLSQRGGGPRLTAVQVRLQEVESELNKVAG